MSTVAEALSIALQRHEAGDLLGAEAMLRRILATDPDQPETLQLMGVISLQSGNQGLSVDYLQRSLAVAPLNEKTHCNLGVAWQSMGRFQEAITAYRQAIQIQPNYFEALSNLGYALSESGRHEEAVETCRRALAIRPDYAQAHTNLAVALQALGKLNEAAGSCREAVRLRPDLVEAHNTLGSILYLQGKNEQAGLCFREALQLRPQDAKVHANLAAVLLGEGKLDDAETELRASLTLQPNSPGTMLNLGGVLIQRGALKEAADCYRIAARANLPAAHSNLLLCLNYDPSVSNEVLFGAHKDWGTRHARTAEPEHGRVSNLEAERRLRIGYVSPDLRAHTVAAFLRPILRHRDSSTVETICYADVSAPDEMTEKLMSLADGWRNIHGMSDDQVAELIRRDQIDILVDLAGHTAANRLLVFAREPAPIQVSYLGYPCTTGLPTVDYYLTDAVCDPLGDEAWFTEKLWRMPRFCCYDPPERAGTPGPLPATGNGFVTFGSFHHLGKLNNQVLDLWARLLREAPTAKLLIFRHTLQGTVREKLLERLKQRGVEPHRVEMLHRPDQGTTHLEMYAKVDISLDVFPWSGHTTACESLWMGVPVVTLRGTRHAGRMVASVLTSAGLPEWIAETPEQYVEIAARSAGNLEDLAVARAGLREKVRTSALCDGKKFTRELETAFREMWQVSDASKKR